MRIETVALVLTALLSLAIVVLTLAPLEGPAGIEGADKVYHLVGFAALILPCAALYPRFLYWAVPAALAQAGLIELIQPYVGRQGEWLDFWADGAGVALGLAVGLCIGKPARSLLRLALRQTGPPANQTSK